MRTPHLGKVTAQTIRADYLPRGRRPPPTPQPPQEDRPPGSKLCWDVGSACPDLMQRRQINPPAGLLPLTGPAGELPPLPPRMIQDRPALTPG